ncbi:MAG TPA: hypothetical protein ENJ86_05765 [Methylothermaceae bacterium]|nr:hypothetical protein [Methylothermaceae bacterium]
MNALTLPAKNTCFHIASMVMATILVTCSAQAATVSYFLDNVVTTHGKTMTGTFEWTYQPGDFENGSGQFSQLGIPGYGSDLDPLSITIAPDSIEFSLKQSFHNKNLDINLRLKGSFTSAHGANIDLGQDANGNYHSKFSVSGFGASGYSGGFKSGAITPLQAVPLPAAAWLLGSAIMGLITLFDGRKKA